MVARSRCPLLCALIVITLGGCDKLFSLTEVESDARVAGDALDARPCNTVVVRDNFDDDILDAALWEPYGEPGTSVAEMGAQAVLSLGTGSVEQGRYADLQTVSAYDLTNRRLAGRLVGVTDLGSNLQAALFARSVDGQDVAVVYLAHQMIEAGTRTAGLFVTHGSTTYDPANHAYLALRFDTALRFEVSRDGITWSSLVSGVPSFSTSALRVGFYVYMDREGIDPGAAQFDDFAVCDVP